MSTKHTPGPWQVFDPKTTGETFGIDGDDGSAVVFYGASEDEGIPRVEDARLIAAAPDLLEALHKAADMLGSAAHFISKSNGLERVLEAQEQAHAAIAKATGEQA